MHSASASDDGRVLAERDAAAVAEDQRPGPAAGALEDLGDDVEVALLERLVVGDERDRHRPDELVALVLGVRPRRLGQLAGEGLGERLEALEVGGRRGRRRCCWAPPAAR